MGRFWALLAAFVLTASTALAQGAVQQAGPVTAYHSAAFQSNGVVADAGAPSTPALSALGLFNGAACPFGVSSQTGPGQSLTAYSLLTICQSPTTTTFTIAGLNGQATPSVVFNIGGVNYPFPGSGSGTVVGPVSSTNNDYVCWNGVGGTVVKDCSVASIMAANTVLGNATAGSTTPTALAVPSCSASNDALIWTAATGFGCQSIAGSGSVTSVATGAGLTGGPITSTGTISATVTTNPQTGTTYTVLSTDNQGIVTLSNASAIAVTLPQATGSFAAGWSSTICDIGAGTATITPTTSTIGGGSTWVLKQGNCVSPVSDGSNYAAVPYTGQINGSFTNLVVNTSVSGSGFSTYLASPPAIGGSAAAAGSFTTLSASSTVSGAGITSLFASPPAIGGTAPAAGAFTTLTASGNTTLSPTGTVTVSPSSTVTISPTGALTVNPTAASTLNNTSVGVTTAAAIRGTTVNAQTSYSIGSAGGHVADSATAPTIASGFGTSPSVVASNGTVAFTINVGTSNTGTGIVTMPTATTGWACSINDITTKSTTVATTQVISTGSSTTAVAVQNYTDIMGTHAWVDSDVLQFLCRAY